MRWYVFISILTIFFVDQGFSQQFDCGSPPQLSQELQQNSTIKGELQSKAKLLSKLVGDAELGGNIESTKNSIYTQSSDFYPAQQEAYLNYVFCSIISSDESLSTQAKIEAIANIRAPFTPGKPQPPACTPAVLKNITIPDTPTLDGEGNHVGSISSASVSIVKECQTDSNYTEKYYLSYGYYNGSGTWRGEQHIILVLKSKEGASIRTINIPVDRSKCVYGGAQKRGSEGILDGGIGPLITDVDFSVSRVTGVQTGC